MSDFVIADSWGRVAPATRNFKKSKQPKLGDAFGAWAGRESQILQLPGGAMLQFDLSRLTLADYRAMRDHYQVNASLSVLTFMLHQLDWHIECENPKIATAIEDNLRKVWTRLVRSMSQSFWAGFSPIALEYENNVGTGRIEISKFKDLVPEECYVNWKTVEGYAPPGHARPKFYEYDGISQSGGSWPIPPENSLWYPILMENGDYYGRKLLRPAFPSWFFSILIHLFANRYYERYGEPLPVGRARFDDDVEVSGSVVSGREAMEQIVANLRNRSVVVLPSDRDPETKEFDYDIEYLESQMRGADFERYLTRLDEEISLSLFTPLLMLRTADVGSYNLGVTHAQMYLMMLNAIAGDMKEYIDRYIVERLKAINFSPNAPRAEWVPRKLGKDNVETLRAIITELLRNDKIKPDLDQIADAVGLNFTEVEELKSDPQNPDPQNPDPAAPADPNAVRTDPRIGRPERTTRGGTQRGISDAPARRRQIAARLHQQVVNAFDKGTFGSTFKPTLGYRRQLMASASNPQAVERLYDNVETWMHEAISLGSAAYSGPDDFMARFERVLGDECERLGF